MVKETPQITRYYDAVLPFGSAFKFSERKYESDTDKDHDVSYSKEHFELESSNPADTVKVATFLRNKQYKPNENINQGERYGIIKFGSRVDIYFKNKKVLAKIGQNVVAGESLLAEK